MPVLAEEVFAPVVDCFAGAGGLSLGLRDAGLTPVFAFDSDPYACKTYNLNLGDHSIQANAEVITPELIVAKTGIEPGGFALVCGGPPCQGFSVQRRGDPVDSRNSLVVDFGQIAISLRPAMVLMENVPAFFGHRGEQERRTLLSNLRRAGYEYECKILNAADFGVPQVRRRAFIVAWDPTRVADFQFPAPTHSEGNYVTVRDALKGLPEPPDDYSEHSGFPNHRRVRISPINEKRISHVPAGGGRTDLPQDLQLPCHRNSNGHRHLDVFGRMDWSKPAPTITAMFDNFTRGRFAHPEEDRCITGREGARLQSFRDSFSFVGPKKDVARQIGNAVPPMLAAAVGRAIMGRLRSGVGGARRPQQMGLLQTIER